MKEKIKLKSGEEIIVNQKEMEKLKKNGVEFIKLGGWPTKNIKIGG